METQMKHPLVVQQWKPRLVCLCDVSNDLLTGQAQLTSTLVTTAINRVPSFPIESYTVPSLYPGVVEDFLKCFPRFGQTIEGIATIICKGSRSLEENLDKISSKHENTNLCLLLWNQTDVIGLLYLDNGYRNQDRVMFLELPQQDFPLAGGPAPVIKLFSSIDRVVDDLCEVLHENDHDLDISVTVIVSHEAVRRDYKAKRKAEIERERNEIAQLQEQLEHQLIHGSAKEPTSRSGGRAEPVNKSASPFCPNVDVSKSFDIRQAWPSNRRKNPLAKSCTISTANGSRTLRTLEVTRTKNEAKLSPPTHCLSPVERLSSHGSSTDMPPPGSHGKRSNAKCAPSPRIREGPPTVPISGSYSPGRSVDMRIEQVFKFVDSGNSVPRDPAVGGARSTSASQVSEHSDVRKIASECGSTETASRHSLFSAIDDLFESSGEIDELLSAEDNVRASQRKQYRGIARKAHRQQRSSQNGMQRAHSSDEESDSTIPIQSPTHENVHSLEQTSLVGEGSWKDIQQRIEQSLEMSLGAHAVAPPVMTEPNTDTDTSSLLFPSFRNHFEKCAKELGQMVQDLNAAGGGSNLTSPNSTGTSPTLKHSPNAFGGQVPFQAETSPLAASRPTFQLASLPRANAGRFEAPSPLTVQPRSDNRNLWSQSGPSNQQSEEAFASHASKASIKSKLMQHEMSVLKKQHDVAKMKEETRLAIARNTLTAILQDLGEVGSARSGSGGSWKESEGGEYDGLRGAESDGPRGNDGSRWTESDGSRVIDNDGSRWIDNVGSREIDNDGRSTANSRSPLHTAGRLVNTHSLPFGDTEHSSFPNQDNGGEHPTSQPEHSGRDTQKPRVPALDLSIPRLNILRNDHDIALEEVASARVLASQVADEPSVSHSSSARTRAVRLSLDADATAIEQQYCSSAEEKYSVVEAGLEDSLDSHVAGRVTRASEGKHQDTQESDAPVPLEEKYQDGEDAAEEGKEENVADADAPRHSHEGTVSSSGSKENENDDGNAETDSRKQQSAAIFINFENDLDAQLRRERFERMRRRKEIQAKVLKQELEEKRTRATHASSFSKTARKRTPTPRQTSRESENEHERSVAGLKPEAHAKNARSHGRHPPTRRKKGDRREDDDEGENENVDVHNISRQDALSSARSDPITTPRTMTKPSNRKVIQNALVHRCLAGPHFKSTRQTVLGVLKDRTINHYVILFRKEVSLKYRGLYKVHDKTFELTKLQGHGPSKVSDNGAIAGYLKYNTGQKSFQEISTLSMTKTIDAIVLNPDYYAKKRAKIAGQEG